MARQTEVSDLRELDIGLLPLPLTEWNKRKFYLKLAQYMALGIPAVCTPLGSAVDAVDHGVTGFPADSEGEWMRYLEKLIEDDQLRATMGAEASRRAHAEFTLQANTGRILARFDRRCREPLRQRSLRGGRGETRRATSSVTYDGCLAGPVMPCRTAL